MSGEPLWRPTTGAERFFWKVTAHPILVLAISVVLTVTAMAGLPKITKDTRAEAFIAADHPAVVYRDKVKEVFGIKDPVVMAVVREGAEGIYNPETLELVQWLTDEIIDVPGVDPDRVMSLATEKDIYGTEDGMIVEPFFEYVPETQEEADAVRAKVMDFPLYLGALSARDGSATIIVAELLDEGNGAKVYDHFLELAERAPVASGEILYVAGEGAVSEYLGTYIDRDAFRLNPVSAVVITLILIVCYRTVRGTVLPNLIVLGVVGGTIGTMAACGVPFYVITNAMPVILIAICVADGIHILSVYYEKHHERPDAGQRELVVRSMAEMWRPVTFTSITDVAGFLGLGLSSFMPPMRAFGVFASVGVLYALLLSLFALPAALMLLKPKGSRPFERARVAGGDVFGRVMGSVGGWVVAHPRPVLIASVMVTLVGVWGMTRLSVDESRIHNFKAKEPIYKADREINKRFDGTSYLEIVVQTDETEALFRPEHLRRMEALQEHVAGLPHVQSVTSIVDYLKQMHRAMNGDDKAFYTLPDDGNLVAQYFLLYSASADPTDFREEIDYDYRLANVRATLNTGRYSDFAPVVRETRRYIEEEFNGEGIKANLAGRVNVDYHWIKDLASNHFTGVLVALVLVWLAAAASFRSLTAGLFATIPVVLSLLSIYSVMGIFDIWLGVGTTMFAAIAIGVSVDFSIHTIDRLIVLIRQEGRPVDEAFAALYPSTGRALLFTFAAMALGFAVLLISEVPPLNRFGMLVGVAVSMSFVASMTILPALIKLWQPAFVFGTKGAGIPTVGDSEHAPAK